MQQTSYQLYGSLHLPRKNRAQLDSLPVGTYVVKHTDMGFALEKVENFKLPKKIYGGVQSDAKRILKTFADRTNSTGVWLDGAKGSGKTMLAKLISSMALKDGISTIIVSEPYHGSDFNVLMQSIDVPCIVFFDEFEKVYHETNLQEELLTLLDGVYPTRKLFLLTTNGGKDSLVDMLISRPGRIFYSLTFEGLSDKFIKEYCKDKLKDQSKINDIIVAASIIGDMSFDVLQAIVEEVNRYGESVADVCSWLNIVPSSSRLNSYFKCISFVLDGKRLTNGWDVNVYRDYTSDVAFNGYFEIINNHDTKQRKHNKENDVSDIVVKSVQLPKQKKILVDEFRSQDIDDDYEEEIEFAATKNALNREKMKNSNIVTLSSSQFELVHMTVTPSVVYTFRSDDIDGHTVELKIRQVASTQSTYWIDHLKKRTKIISEFNTSDT